MRDLLRQLERNATNYKPARPGTGTTPFAAMAMSAPAEVRIGEWRLLQNDLGELVAVHDNGTGQVLAKPEVL
jgi:hypothetical protein